jgi:restriction system protein
MSLPTYQEFMIDVLRVAKDGEVRVAEIVGPISDQHGLSEQDRVAKIPSGQTTVVKNRIDWAASYLVQAKLLERPRRGYIKLTDRGRKTLEENPKSINLAYLKRYPEFVEFLKKSYYGQGGDAADTLLDAALARPVPSDSTSATPEDLIRQSAGQYNASLSSELLDRIVKAPPEFFERVLVQLLVAMGYGGASPENAGKSLGRSGDDGVDGVVDGDPLGLDRVFVQAKRYRLGNSVGAPAIRDFYGALNLKKGVERCLLHYINIYTRRHRHCRPL